MISHYLSGFAVGAALTWTQPAGAVAVNPDGLGEVLLYPYYTTRGGIKTLVSVVNTRNESKIVKVRFLEGYNSREVLDFNLFLSPFDIWVAAIEDDPDGEGAHIITPDTSCSVGMIPAAGEPFREFAYTGSKDDGGPQGLDRTREGHLEMIEMGELDGTAAGGQAVIDAVDHQIDGGTDCMIPFLAYFGAPLDTENGRGLWNPLAGGSPENAVSEPTGGLYGAWELIHVERGDAVAGEPTALVHFFDPDGPGTRSDESLHTIPGTLLPNLGSADQGLVSGLASALVTDLRTAPGTGAPRQFSALFSDGIDAVSATLMREQIFVEYTANVDVGAATAAVMTFPTKNGYVDVRAGGSFGELPPFTAASFTAGIAPGSACERLSVVHWDREEELGIGLPGDFSPTPPADQAFSLCWETNVVEIGALASALSDSALAVQLPIRTDFSSGHAVFDMSLTLNEPGTDIFRRALTSDEPDAAGNITRLFGLPVIGFSIFTRANNFVGVGARYSSSFRHRYGTCIQSGESLGTEQPLARPDHCE